MPPQPVEGPSSYFFDPAASRQCAEEIATAGGVEVFFIGRRDPDNGLISEVESHAYGNAAAVPALAQLAKPGDILIHNHPSGNLLPSDPDLSIAAPAGNMGIGFYIIDNGATRCRVVVKAQDAKKKVDILADEIATKLSPSGSLVGAVDQFEDRPEQREMALSVARALNNDGVSIVEAGTGTGKSFAYLVPAILYAVRNDERIVVSTNTINLQEQLLHKDIPALRRALGEDFEVEIVKGRGNYVCKRKAEYARDEVRTLAPDEFTRELGEVLQWITHSTNGDRQELPVPPRHEVWERVQSEADNCLRLRCPFYESCFFYNSRRRAARAKVLIVNHSLLLSDLAVRRATGNYTMAAVLPPYKRVILDEAHHLEEVATKSLAQQVTRAGLRQMMGRLYRRESSGGGRGVLNNLGDVFDNLARDRKLPQADSLVMRITTELIPGIPDVRDSLDFLFADFSSLFLRAARIDRLPGREELKVRLTPAIRTSKDWIDECERLLHAMCQELTALISRHQEAIEQIDEWEDDDLQEAILNPVMEWRALVGRLDGLRSTLLSFINPKSDECQWVELAQRQGHSRSGELIVRLCVAPIEVRTVLKEALHDRMKTEVLTSATLAVDKDFEFFADRCGLPGAERPGSKPELGEDGEPIIRRKPTEARLVERVVLPSPFDYRRQVFFAVPTDMADPRAQDFDDDLAELINRSVAISGGRAFVLFTSYGQLKKLATICEPTFRRLGISLLRHGEENRDVLIRKFREDETSVLFGTSSFWEGVDVKGRALELLILAKLPFSVPTEPIQEAQFEAIKAAGRDPFTSLVVPRAVIRFKQGFGRLIRSRTDRGAVIVADKRVIQMGYGQRFLRSLGDIEVRRGPRHELLAEMETFFSSPPPA
jgi:ATP-dependent DNA helicase DinG